MKKLSKDKRNKLALVTVASLVVAAALWFTLIAAQKSNLIDLANRNAEELRKLELAQKVVDTRVEAEKRLEETKGRLREIENDMVKGDMYDWIIQTVKTFKSPYRDRIDIPNFSREVVGDIPMFPRFPYRAATYNIRGTAYYHDLGRFIADLENRFPFMRVQNLELEPASSTSATATEDKEKLAFRFELVALVRPTRP
ncbi:MAG: hypothetical protein HYR88_18630 [Verrucomicrobia bacterium]|nr:hypothetical protein [Verrucomicrobiota bacterium]MBI3870787.1 hypothetical protein [Verrucomicrobiota bacterium]